MNDKILGLHVSYLHDFLKKPKIATIYLSMPYITSENQEKFSTLLFQTESNPASNSGELNFLLTKVIISYLENKGLTYQTCNDIVGGLENCKGEFQERIQKSYEISKASSNGDVYKHWKDYLPK